MSFLLFFLHICLFFGEDVAFGKPGLLTDFSVRGENELEVSSYTLAILCYETQLEKFPNSVFQLRVTNSCVEGRAAVKTGLQRYCDTSYSMGGVNQIWIMKNSKDLLEYIQSRSLSSCNSI
jgi:hypothetical protein